MNTRNIVKNIRSSEVIEGKPKLPTSGQLSEGEIAVNYAKGYETLSFKNNSKEIVSLSVKTVDDVTVNGNSVVSNKTANITMKGNTTPVADTYTETTFPSSFNEWAEHISASDNVDVALKKVETNISKLVDKLDFYYSNSNNDVTNLQTQINSLREIIGDTPTMEFVDLGLPSGTLWAKCNIGATSESDYGDYFMWGSTTPNTNTICDWSTAPFNNGTNEYDSNYFNSVKNTVWPNDILAKGYDVAYKTTNGAARMPTEAEFIELISNTRMEWTQVSDVNGWKFTSKTDTSKYIFIPAAGYRMNGSVNHIGKQCVIWSSSLNTSSSDFAYYLGLYSGSYSVGNDGSRFVGNSVRAVRNLPL